MALIGASKFAQQQQWGAPQQPAYPQQQQWGAPQQPAYPQQQQWGAPQQPAYPQQNTKGALFNTATNSPSAPTIKALLEQIYKHVATLTETLAIKRHKGEGIEDDLTAVIVPDYTKIAVHFSEQFSIDPKFTVMYNFQEKMGGVPPQAQTGGVFFGDKKVIGTGSKGGAANSGAGANTTTTSALTKAVTVLLTGFIELIKHLEQVIVGDQNLMRQTFEWRTTSLILRYSDGIVSMAPSTYELNNLKADYSKAIKGTSNSMG